MVIKDVTATIEDLLQEPGKAELIGGRIVRYMSTGEIPNLIAGRIFRHLADFVERARLGFAYTDNMGFAVPELPSGRQSFSPDVSFVAGPRKKTMRFLETAPTLAIEVRSENEYKPGTEAGRAAKRADYFAAGTLVVWDVDPLGECIYAYRASDPQRPATFRRGQQADGEPAVSGWRVDVEWVFA